jgi:hypothetical protein
MGESVKAQDPHEHTLVTRVVLLQKHGVPYEVERSFCFSCRRVLSERPLKRTAA